MSEFAPEPAGQPFAPLEQPIHWMVSACLHIVLGMALGLAAAGVLRRCHARWTWSLMPLPLLALAPGVLHTLGAFGASGAVGTSRAFDASGLTLATASVCAALRGLATHRHDLGAGGESARAAAARTGPLDVLRLLACRYELRRCALPRGGWLRDGWLRDGRLLVGRSRHGQLVSIPLAGEKGGRHTLVLGATGSGKTVTETWIAERAIEAGLGAVVVDPKGDDRLRAGLARAARDTGRRLLEWTPEGPCVYNPFAQGSPSEIADKALAGERFTEPHYLRQAQRYLGHAARALHGAGRTVSLAALAEQLVPERLEALARTLPEAQARMTHEYLDSLTARQRADLTGVRDRLAIVAESDAGPWLDPETADHHVFDVLGAIRERAVVLFRLHADRWPLLAQMLGAAIVQDVVWAASMLHNQPISTLVVLDEFSSLAAERVLDVCGKARDAGFNFVLATQELSDLRLAHRERLLEQLQGNLSTVIAHRQVVPESIELLVRLAGGREATTRSYDSRKEWRSMSVREALLDAEQLRTLPAGHAAVIEPGERDSAQVARVFASVEQARVGR